MLCTRIGTVLCVSSCPSFGARFSTNCISLSLSFYFSEIEGLMKCQKLKITEKKKRLPPHTRVHSTAADEDKKNDDSVGGSYIVLHVFLFPR